MRIPPAHPPQPVFTLHIFAVRSSTSRRCRSRASSPRRACRPSSGGPCCTCRTAAGWARTTAPPRPTGSTAAPPRSTTSSPPRVRRTGGSSTGLKKPPPPHFPGAVTQSCGMLCEDLLFSLKSGLLVPPRWQRLQPEALGFPVGHPIFVSRMSQECPRGGRIPQNGANTCFGLGPLETF